MENTPTASQEEDVELDEFSMDEMVASEVASIEDLEKDFLMGDEVSEDPEDVEGDPMSEQNEPDSSSRIGRWLP